MDAKLTLSFDKEVIKRAKTFADQLKISLSRLTELLYQRMTQNTYTNLEDLPIADWVYEIAEGQIEYKLHSKSNKQLRSEYLDSKKKDMS